MPKNPPFSPEIKTKCLLWCDRHCCLCGKQCGTSIEVAHIVPKASGGKPKIDNAIPLCPDCHTKIGNYNPQHPKGNKYKPEELESRREQIYEKYTSHLIPKVYYTYTQFFPNRTYREFPDVGFIMENQSDYLPARLQITSETFLGSTSLGVPDNDYYSGKTIWNLNPGFSVFGGYYLPGSTKDSTEDVQIQVSVIVIDAYEREHKLLPVVYRYLRDSKQWNFEPKGLTFER